MDTDSVAIASFTHTHNEHLKIIDELRDRIKALQEALDIATDSIDTDNEHDDVDCPQRECPLCEINSVLKGKDNVKK